MRLLVVDFDYFFPVPQDPGDPLAPLFAWAHFETPYYLLEAWEERALAFLLRGLPLPEARGWQGFWGRFAFAPGAVLYYAESNALAFHPEVRRGVEEVVLFDAHHDAGYRPLGEEPACDDWMVFYHRLGARLRVYYPPWRGPLLGARAKGARGPGWWTPGGGWRGSSTGSSSAGAGPGCPLGPTPVFSPFWRRRPSSSGPSRP